MPKMLFSSCSRCVCFTRNSIDIRDAQQKQEETWKTRRVADDTIKISLHESLCVAYARKSQEEERN